MTLKTLQFFCFVGSVFSLTRLTVYVIFLVMYQTLIFIPCTCIYLYKAFIVFKCVLYVDIFII